MKTTPYPCRTKENRWQYKTEDEQKMEVHRDSITNENKDNNFSQFNSEILATIQLNDLIL